MTAFSREYSEQYQYGVKGQGRRSDEEIKFTRGYHNALTPLDQALSGVGIMHSSNACNTVRTNKTIAELSMGDLIPDEPSRELYRSFSA